jgi:hypothetical protein
VFSVVTDSDFERQNIVGIFWRSRFGTLIRKIIKPMQAADPMHI